MWDSRAAKCTLTAALVLCLLYGIYLIRGVLFVLTVAVMLAYLLYPMVSLVTRYLPGRSRTPALALVYLLLIAALATLGVTLGGRAASEAKSLSERAPALIDRLRQSPTPSGNSDLASIKETVLDAAQKYLYEHYNEFVSFLPGLTLQVLKASTNLLYVVIVPVMSFFLLKDGGGLRDNLVEFFDEGESREFAKSLLEDVHRLLLQYMRALFSLCLVTLVTFAIVLASMGVPDAILLASIAFPLEFIPLVGPLGAAVAIISVTLLNGYAHLLWVILFLVGYRLVQDYVISPRLMSEGIELHPLLVILGVFAGGEIGGVAGTFLSVPALALLRVVYRRAKLPRAVA